MENNELHKTNLFVMHTNQTEKDLLRTMFRRLPEEKLPAAFRQEMMVRIRRESKRIRRRNRTGLVLAYAAAIMLFAGLTVGTYMYLEIPAIGFEWSYLSVSPFYLLLGILSFALLMADYLFRQAYAKRHPDTE